MKNVHLIPTDRPSRLRVGDNGNFVFGMIQTSIQSKNDDFTNQHLYITSDEEIKEGDWFYCFQNNNVLKCFKKEGLLLNGYHTIYKKIILTTDQDLIGVQSIDDEFLEWFVKNPSCEFVEVQDMSMQYHDEDYYEYKIIIPQEEPKMTECYFIPSNNTSSATICGNCGQEKFFHTIGKGVKTSKLVVIKQEKPKQETLEDSIYQAIGLAANEQGIINQALATSKVMDVLKKQIYETRNT